MKYSVHRIIGLIVNTSIHFPPLFFFLFNEIQPSHGLDTFTKHDLYRPNSFTMVPEASFPEEPIILFITSKTFHG